VPAYIDGSENRNGTLGNHPLLALEIDEESNAISFVHVTSSLNATIHRLLFAREVYEIENFNPPFSRKSYADTRGIYLIEYCSGMLTALLSGGAYLNDRDFSQIISNTKFENIISFSKDELKSFNQHLNYDDC